MNYTLSRQRGEVLLCFTPEILLSDLERGSVLARVLGGRLSKGYVGYWLPPSAARKWEALFDAGFSAFTVQRSGDKLWRFGRGGAEKMRLAAAVKVARMLRVPV